MGTVVEALLRYTGSCNVIGACDMPGQCVRRVADVLQQDPDKLKVEYVGLNQIGWIEDIKFDGRSRMGGLELLEERREEDSDYDLIELFRMAARTPTPRSISWPRRGGQAPAGLRAVSAPELLHEAEKQILKLYEDPRLTEVPALTRQRNALWYQETILPVIDALEGRKENAPRLKRPEWAMHPRFAGGLLHRGASVGEPARCATPENRQLAQFLCGSFFC